MQNWAGKIFWEILPEKCTTGLTILFKFIYYTNEYCRWPAEAARNSNWGDGQNVPVTPDEFEIGTFGGGRCLKDSL